MSHKLNIQDVKSVIEHIDNAIQKAEVKQSHINQNVLNITGMSSCKIRHLLNNLASFDQCSYLEVGSWQGSTVSSVLSENILESCYIVENFSEFANPSVRINLLTNIATFKGENKVTFIEEDFFTMDVGQIKNKINLFLYDGNHSEAYHETNIIKVWDALDDYFIYLVDDIQFEQVIKGLNKSLNDLVDNNKIELIYQRTMDGNGKASNNKDNWWNGYYIAYMKKTKNN